MEPSITTLEHLQLSSSSSAVEGLDEPVLRRLTRIDVMPLNQILAGQFQDRPTGKFGPIARWATQKGADQIDLPHNLLPIHGDAVRLQQVLVNLINNAIEAMFDSPLPTRSVRITARNEAEHVIVSVEDNGPGISKENLDILFSGIDGLGCFDPEMCRDFGCTFADRVEIAHC